MNSYSCTNYGDSGREKWGTKHFEKYCEKKEIADSQFVWI